MRAVEPGIIQADRPSNVIKSTRYTLLSFVPLVLYEQFSRALHAYFLVLAFVQLVPGLSPTSPIAMWTPLLFVLGISAIQRYDMVDTHIEEFESDSCFKCAG